MSRDWPGASDLLNTGDLFYLGRTAHFSQTSSQKPLMQTLECNPILSVPACFKSGVNGSRARIGKRWMKRYREALFCLMALPAFTLRFAAYQMISSTYRTALRISLLSFIMRVHPLPDSAYYVHTIIPQYCTFASSKNAFPSLILVSFALLSWLPPPLFSPLLYPPVTP